MDVQHTTAGSNNGLLEFCYSLPIASLGNVGNSKHGHRGVTVGEMSDYGYTVEIKEGYDEAVLRTRMALRGEGFSILTEAHVGDVLRPEGAGENSPPAEIPGKARQYLIMGAWNSPISENLRDSSIQVGFHLPCNVVVHENGDSAIVAALDPADTVETTDVEFGKVVEAARGALHRVLEKVASAG
jgi:uncharacterized protein (DUF302 family)